MCHFYPTYKFYQQSRNCSRKKRQTYRLAMFKDVHSPTCFREDNKRITRASSGGDSSCSYPYVVVNPTSATCRKNRLNKQAVKKTKKNDKRAKLAGVFVILKVGCSRMLSRGRLIVDTIRL